MKEFTNFWYIILSILISCSSNDSRQNDKVTIEQTINLHKIEEINEFILDEVKSHQVVLLGESKHNQYIYKQSVIEFLNYWIERIEKDETSPRKIGLILENPHYFGKKLNTFFNNGDMSQLAYDSHFVLNATVADLEYYQDLKNLHDRIDKLNKNSLKENPIEFKVICVEKDIPMMASKEVRNKFFRTERDIYTANKIEEKTKELPSYKFVGTFGAFHIVKERIPDDNIPRLAEELISKGTGTYTINRSLFSENPFRINFDSEQKDFVLPLSNVDKFDFATKSNVINAWIFYNGAYFNDILINNIPSINLIQNSLDYAKQYPNSYSSPLFWLWNRFTGEMIPRTQNLIGYIESRLGTVNVIDIVDNMTLFENIFKAFEKINMPIPEINKHISNLTGYSEFDELFFIPNDSSAIGCWKEYIDDNKDKIKVRLLTAILYYGTDTEQSLALEKLKQLTHKDFTTKKEWLNWYRKNR
ncbi:MAG: hypothetical protein ACFFC1_18125 [Promethearchaeota archaeon]